MLDLGPDKLKPRPGTACVSVRTLDDDLIQQCDAFIAFSHDIMAEGARLEDATDCPSYDLAWARLCGEIPRYHEMLGWIISAKPETFRGFEAKIRALKQHSTDSDDGKILEYSLAEDAIRLMRAKPARTTSRQSRVMLRCRHRAGFPLYGRDADVTRRS